MKKILDLISLHNVDFKKKMMAIYLVSIFFPMLIVGMVYCLSVRNHVEKNNIAEIKFDFNTTIASLEEIFDQTRTVSDEIYYDRVLLKNLAKTAGTISDFVDVANEIENLSRYYSIYDCIENIKIYTYNDTLYRTGMLRRISEMLPNTPWYNQFVSSGKDYAVISYFDSSSNKSTVSIVRRLNQNGICRDILKIDIFPGAINNELLYNEKKGTFYLLNENKECIAASNNKDLQNIDFSTLADKSNVISHEFIMPKYTLCCEYNDSYLGGMGKEVALFILLLIVIIAVSAGLVYLTSYSMLKKIKELTAAAEKAQSGIFEKVSEKDIGYDEIGKLTRGYNTAISQIDILIHEVYDVKLKTEQIENEKSRAEFIALTRQVNPHFLFNILEMMRMNCIKKGNRDIADMMRNLSIMFRYQISWKKDLVFFKDEFTLIKAYVDIYKTNFEGNVDINIDVEEAVESCRIPKMSAQIFVENAFRHGLESLARDRVFEFRAYRSEDWLIIRISDNGKGIDKAITDAVNSGDMNKIKETAGEGITNVISRLNLYFKDNFSVYMTSSPFEKTEVILQLPFKLETDEWE